MPWGAPYYGSKAAQIALFDSLVSAHPTLIRKETIGYTVQGQALPMYRVGNVNGGKFLFDGAIHGCSDLSTICHYLFLKWLLESGEARANNILQKKCLLVVPAFNLDRSERKNARDVGLGWRYGVDLNRNFSYNWSSSGTTDPIDDYYHGPNAASEPETQAMKNLFVSEQPEIYVNFHNWGGPIFRSVCANSAQQTFSQKLANDYSTVRQQLGIAYTYSYGQGGLSAGYSTADAALATGMKASFLIEICNMNDPNEMSPAVERIEPEFYPRIKPILIAFAEAVTDGLTPSQKYLFSQWQDEKLDNPRTVVT